MLHTPKEHIGIHQNPQHCEILRNPHIENSKGRVIIFFYEGDNIEYYKFKQSTKHEHKILDFDEDFIKSTRHHRHHHSYPCNDHPRNRNTNMYNLMKRVKVEAPSFNGRDDPGAFID